MFSSTFLLPQLRDNEQELFLFVKHLLLFPASQLVRQYVLIKHKALQLLSGERDRNWEERKKRRKKGEVGAIYTSSDLLAEAFLICCTNGHTLQFPLSLLLGEWIRTSEQSPLKSVTL